MQLIYLVLCVIGAALPLSQFIPWLSANGINMPLLLQQAIATRVSAFAWADVLVSGIAVLLFIAVEGRRLAMPRLWIPAACMLVGPSLALPGFLLMRERHLAAAPPQSA
ncbi:DUF2834 domain-containing protein [Pseudoxanthomonas sp. PXM01]|uniref:DUF2834 domain-containing protein n=1 Tax=Pseudoxanthomonas sp. PXM01 TaxID=2769295 RepID=UPI00177C54D2|nr:DUF2834 domain-containing protein [Pseudoxanthomonas sp. PXM01]MBD9468387.1 DUF2834 domain-containing protein [Pseudoxanthomonas sp. PXM01]